MSLLLYLYHLISTEKVLQFFGVFLQKFFGRGFKKKGQRPSFFIFYFL
tara:strand:+ start:12258 stop:12401 length:144 start_codon:yes stop_codon:yes gene_type:complete